ncbi:MAG TPA: class I SAM-dependent methyltransferase [Anaerolineales bacterium]
MNPSPKKTVHYDQIASTYDRRYAARPLKGVAGALHALVQGLGAGQILEVGCGTGRWLAELQPDARQIVGLDLSTGMLKKAAAKTPPSRLVCGQAGRLPFLPGAFDLVLCVNALHHFPQPAGFIREARRLLRKGGALAVIGMDPHTGSDRWYLYDYFEGTYPVDLSRYPSGGAILDWMTAAGFERVERRVAELIERQFSGREVLGDPFLQKDSTSQLVLLSDEAYAAGMRRIERDLAAAEEQGRALIFQVNLSLALVCGYV